MPRTSSVGLEDSIPGNCLENILFFIIQRSKCIFISIFGIILLFIQKIMEGSRGARVTVKAVTASITKLCDCWIFSF